MLAMLTIRLLCWEVTWLTVPSNPSSVSSGAQGTGLWHCLLLRLAGEVQKNIMMVDE